MGNTAKKLHTRTVLTTILGLFEFLSNKKDFIYTKGHANIALLISEEIKQINKNYYNNNLKK